jgi:hypothetical protein
VMLWGEYEASRAMLGGNAWICGRTTMQEHFAEAKPFVSAMAACRPAPSPPTGPRRTALPRARASGLDPPWSSRSPPSRFS